jgi:chromosome segregation ATPase
MEACTMNADQVLGYLDQQEKAIEALTQQLDEIQVTFNAQFDAFKARHDATLDRLIDQIAGQMDAAAPGLRAAVEERLPEERKLIDERRQKVRETYLPQRQQAADALLSKAQAELAQLRTLNPQINDREEELKRQKAELEARLAALNEEIRHKSRGLGLVWHFLAITRADRERQRIVGKLEVVNDSLYTIRRQWEEERKKMGESQSAYQEQWQLESIAVARLQSELDQLDDPARREDLALRRATRHVLDALKEPFPGSENAGLEEMIELNRQTDAYHEGLASVAGFIGLLRGIDSGLEAIGKSIKGLKQEQEMHSAYLKPLSFSLPPPIEAFHKQWPALAQQFADEQTIGTHPADFAATVKPLLEGPLSQANIEAMFNNLGAIVQEATQAW